MSTLLSTKADDIARVLEDEIVGGLIAPGTVLRQEQLSERFEVSRTPVREALRRLAALGLVSFEPNRGVRVRSVSPAELREAYLVRAELESLATEVATPRMTAADLEALDAAEERFSALTLQLREQARHGLASESPLFVEWMQANYAFHDVIYGVAAMPFVERLAKSARRTFIGDRVWSARVELDELYAKNDLQHRAIRDAIAAGSAAGARLLAREHVLSSGRLLEIVIESLGTNRARRRLGRLARRREDDRRDAVRAFRPRLWRVGAGSRLGRDGVSQLWAREREAARFCEACGAALGGESGERRKVVSVVFCDVVGSTALGESTDPEALRAAPGARISSG